MTPAKPWIPSTSSGTAVLLALALALLASASLGVAAAHSSASKRCGTVLHGSDRYFGIKARGVSCATARRMTTQSRVNINRLAKACNCSISGPITVLGFTCKSENDSGPPVRDPLLDCRKSGARVTWHHGLPVGSCGYTRTCNSSEPLAGARRV